jgi:hypothetical protein
LTRGAGDDLRTVAFGLLLQQLKTVVLIVPSVLLFCINIVLKEIQHLTGMTHCASFSGMECNGSDPEVGEQSTVSLPGYY